MWRYLSMTMINVTAFQWNAEMENILLIMRLLIDLNSRVGKMEDIVLMVFVRAEAMCARECSNKARFIDHSRVEKCKGFEIHAFSVYHEFN